MTPAGWSASSEVFGALLASSPRTHYIYANIADLLKYQALRDRRYHLGLLLDIVRILLFELCISLIYA
jgi:hypothetical protein